MDQTESKATGTRVLRYVICIILCFLSIIPFYILLINSTLKSSPHHLHDGTKVGLDFAPGAGDAQAGDQVQEPFRLLGDHGDAVGRGGSDEGDEIDPVLMAEGQKLLLLLEGQVGQNQAVHADVPTGGDELFRAVGKYHIGISHEHHRHGHVLAQLPHEVKNLVGGHASLQRPQVGSLDDRPFGHGVGERDAQLDEVGAVLDGGANGGGGGL